MWKKIVSTDSVIAIHTGDIVSQNPDDPSLDFKIHVKESGYVSVVHTNGKESMKFFPINYLYYDNWYLKE
jgi:hypothetical protein